MQARTFETFIRSTNIVLALISIIVQLYWLNGIHTFSLLACALSALSLFLAFKFRYYLIGIIIIIGVLAHRLYSYLWIQSYIDAKRSTGGPGIGIVGETMTWPGVDFVLIMPFGVLIGFLLHRYLLPRLFRKV
jgi:hypothetical protein